MILENFDFLETNNMVYGGHAGSKLGVVIEKYLNSIGFEVDNSLFPKCFG